jgi:hypothetical protein
LDGYRFGQWQWQWQPHDTLRECSEGSWESVWIKGNLLSSKTVLQKRNVLQNSLTGISAVSQENAVLDLSDCDLVADGAQQLEMPPDGGLSHRQSLTRDNNMIDLLQGAIRVG